MTRAMADTILVNGDIVTMDPLLPRATALAVRDGKILAIGGDDDITDLKGPLTQVINAGGRMVLPGMQDTHIHLQDSGYQYSAMADLTGAVTHDALLDRLADFAAGHEGEWVLGVAYDTGAFSEANLSRADLDRAVPDRPCHILSADLHSSCLNTAGCTALGLTRDTPDPDNGLFARDARGEPTGMLHESAMEWAHNRMPPVTDDDYVKGIAEAQALCHRNGLTGVIDPRVTERHARVYQRMAAEGSLGLRVGGAGLVLPELSVEDNVAALVAMRDTFSGGLFHLHSAKFFLDGVFENRTAAMIDGYKDAAGGNYPLMFDPDHLNALCVALDALRFQIHMHVIGDYAARAGLDGVEAALRANGAWPSLHQLTHVECVHPADIGRFADLGAVANMQCLWARNAPTVTKVAVPMTGADRSADIYPFGALVDAGATATLSSDWGVSTLNPFKIMEVAMTRQKVGQPDDPPFHPEHRLSREDALKGYTLNAAAAAWRPETGRLSRHTAADLIVIDRDILTCDTYEIGATEVLLTLFAGSEVHRSERFNG